ncbi:MAG: GNAT family N-acetyltransferase [Lachnospiraceae bacterium]|nr:GNAT family N-acetyltransferase [Lachnospiraceae bacterium]
MKLIKDAFNTEIFQMTMGNLILEKDTYSREEIKTWVKEAKQKGYQHLAIKILTEQKDLLNSLLQEQFYLVDTLIEYVFDAKKKVLPKIQHQCILRDCEKEDLPALKQIARNSFKTDRFHSDMYLENELCNQYYEKWMENSYHGFAEKVIAAEYCGELVGFFTGKTYSDDKYGHLVLAAVSDKHRGIGVYTSMIHECIRWMLEAHTELEGVMTGTQIETVAVQKAWIKLGFTVHDSLYVLHRYLGE